MHHHTGVQKTQNLFRPHLELGYHVNAECWLQLERQTLELGQYESHHPLLALGLFLCCIRRMGKQ